MQADVQRNINQQSRIEQGIQSGQLTNKETSQLERAKPGSIGLKHVLEQMVM